MATAGLASNVTHAQCRDFVLKGPLLASCGIGPTDVDANIQQWVDAGQQLAHQLSLHHAEMDDAQRQRIYHYYLPAYFWCLKQLEAHKSSGSEHALVLGISAPQGCGKTTLVEQLQQLFNSQGRRAACVSIDDFYLTYEDQRALAAAHPGNRLLQYRGNAGTHDLQLGSSTLAALRGLTAQGSAVSVPRYDKSAHAGRGDRADPSTWPTLEGPLEVVFFEGWMSGFAPVPQAQAAAIDPDLQQVNDLLQVYSQAWDSLVDSWLVIRIADPQWVFNWRQQAEARMRESGRPGMTDAQVADFVSRFMPAYKAYLPGLYEKGPTTTKPGHLLVVELDQNRSPVEQQPSVPRS